MLAWHLRKEHETCNFPRKVLPMADLLRSADGHLMSEISDDMIDDWAKHHRQQPGVERIRSKAQWRKFKRETASLMKSRIDPSKITKAGVYYPEGTPMLARLIDKVRRFLRRNA